MAHRFFRQFVQEQDRKVLLLASALATMMALATPQDGFAADERWQFGSVPTFSSGKYGTDTRTDVLQTPIVVRRLFTDGDLTVVLPYTCIWGNGSVTIVNGSPVRQQRLANSATTASGARGGRAGGAAATTSTPTTTTSHAPDCGMGDIVVRGLYYIVDEGARAPAIAIRAHVKAPTASAERGLGTGRPDEGIGVEVSRTLGAGLLAMVDTGYTMIGQPDGVAFNNSWWYDVGLGRNVAGDVVNLSVFFERYRALVTGLADAQDLLATVSVKAAGGWRVQLSGQFGLSDGAPDHGLTFGASRRF